MCCRVNKYTTAQYITIRNANINPNILFPPSGLKDSIIYETKCQEIIFKQTNSPNSSIAFSLYARAASSSIL